MGATDYAIVDLRVVATIAALSTASRFILAHNHPSGLLTPSDADKETTRQVAEMLRFIGSQLIDHIIFSDTGHLSMNELGYL